MSSIGKKVILADCSADGLQDFLSAFKEKPRSNEWVVLSSVANWGRQSKVDNLRRYVKYFSFPLEVFLHREQYEMIIGWQQFYALTFCFFSNIFHVKKKQALIVALNFTYKEKSGFIGKLYKWFVKRAVSNKYLDYIHVPSHDYAEIFSKEFNYPFERILVCPFGVEDRSSTYSGCSIPEDFGIAEHFALAIGRSNRDYDFLIQAWRGIDLPLIVICDTIEINEADIPDNVKVIKTVSGVAQFPFIMNCTMLILPLKDGSIPSGDTVLLTAMSFSKIVIVTQPSTIAEMYIKDGVNGLTINKTERELKEAVYHALQDNTLGVTARKDYENNYSLKAMGDRIYSLLPL
ncbi:MAG: glycosyltransferase [Prevotellaceae bacterium]|nr:glycosyltransferase [Prevotellaceae bacterium]